MHLEWPMNNMINGKLLPSRPGRRLAARGASRGVRMLVTGFGPFPEVPFNASGALVGSLGEGALPSEPRVRLFTALLPTDWRAAPRRVAALIEEICPDVILHFGVSRRARGFEIETRAFNAASPAQDCAGRLPPGYHIRRGAPPMLTAALPGALLVRRLRSAGIRASLSHDAGRYLCNAVLYHTLFRSQRLDPPPLAGFIHIPALPPVFDTTPMGGAVLGWPALERGAAMILDTMAVFAGRAKRRGLETRSQIG